MDLARKQCIGLRALQTFLETYLGPVQNIELSVKRENRPFRRNLPFSYLWSLSPELRRAADINIGALWIHPVTSDDGRRPEKQLVWRNFLLFDIDGNDFPRRDCCGELKTVCSKCWPLIVSAVRAVLHIMRTDFGISSVPLITVSGGRGAHIRYFDAECVNMNDRIRGSLVRYLQWRLSQYVIPARDWKEIYTRLGWFERTTDWPSLFVPLELSAVLVSSIVCAWSGSMCSSPQERWEYFETNYPEYAKRFVLHYAAPRIDANVTTRMDHLGRLPFSIHQTSRRFCLPLPSIEDLEKYIPGRQTRDSEEEIQNGIETLWQIVKKTKTRISKEEASCPKKAKTGAESVADT